MKRSLLLLLTFLLLATSLAACGQKADTMDLKLITYNIQCFNNDISWDCKQSIMEAFIDKYEPDVVGLQEVTMGEGAWIKYLPGAFGKKYKYVGEARTDVATEGLEACLIFYRKDKFKLLKSDTFWLSESGEKGSKGWGANCPRVCTYVLLKSKASGKKILVMNTHLDHVSNDARINGFDMVMAKAKEISNFDYPVFILGDLNAHENQTNGSYDHYMSYEEIVDARYKAKTSTGGKTYIPSKHDNPIDFVFLSDHENITVNIYQVMDEYDIHEDYPFIDMSDHYGVYVNVTIN